MIDRRECGGRRCGAAAGTRPDLRIVRPDAAGLICRLRRTQIVRGSNATCRGCRSTEPRFITGTRGATRTTLAARRTVEVLRRSLPNHDYGEIAAAGHMSPLTHPDRVNTIVEAHIVENS